MRTIHRFGYCLVFAALLLCWSAVAATAQQPAPAAPAAPPSTAASAKLDSGDTAWMLTLVALVLMMTIPGLALFYGGMVRKMNARHRDAELHGDMPRHRVVDGVHLQHGLNHRQPLCRRHEPVPADGDDARFGERPRQDHPRICLLYTSPSPRDR